MTVRPVPEGYHTVTPYLVVDGAAAAIAFIQKAFDGRVIEHHATPEGKVMHAVVQIGDSRVMLGDANEQYGPRPCNICLYVADTDRFYRQALAAGAAAEREPTDMFYGERTAGVVDAHGNQWWMMTHIEDVAPEELARRSKGAS
jgi:uncharacterized glyoxalase superfamily protein PhnB